MNQLQSLHDQTTPKNRNIQAKETAKDNLVGKHEETTTI